MRRQSGSSPAYATGVSIRRWAKIVAISFAVLHRVRWGEAVALGILQLGYDEDLGALIEEQAGGRGHDPLVPLSEGGRWISTARHGAGGSEEEQQATLRMRHTGHLVLREH